MQRNKLNITLTIAIIAAVFYLFSNVVPYYSDDWWHTFIHHPHGDYPTERISDLGDVATSQVNHYMNKNGRLPVTFVAQSVVTFISKDVFNILNTIAYILMVVLFARYCFASQLTPKRLICVAVTLFFLLPGHYDVMMWATGAIYYIWVAVYILAILLLWRRLATRDTSKRYYPLLLLAGILAGWSNEAISFGLAAGVACELLLQRDKRKASLLWLAAGIVIGAIMIIIAPGSWKRTGWVSHSIANIHLYISLWVTLLIPLLLFVLLFLLHKRNPQRAKAFFRQHCISIVASAALVPVCIVTWQYAARSCFGLAFFSFIPLLALCESYLFPRFRSHRWWQYAAVAIVVAFTSLLYAEHCRIEKYHRSLITQFSQGNDGVVILDMPQRAWYASPFTINLNMEYNYLYQSRWSDMHMAAYYEKPRLQWLSPELHHLLTHPQELFVEANRVPGNNNLYTTPTLDVYIILPHMPLPKELAYTYEPAAFSDSVPLHAKLLRLLMPQRYPLQEVLPAYLVTYELPQYGTFHCINKNQYRDVVAIDELQ